MPRHNRSPRRAQSQRPGAPSALRAASPRNPRNLPCPACGAKNRLTPADMLRGYHCDRCARTEVGVCAA
jgi:hypothetical protein